MVKLHQQRMQDMKKTFQRELRSSQQQQQQDFVNGAADESFPSDLARLSRSPTPASSGAGAGAGRLSPAPPPSPGPALPGAASAAASAAADSSAMSTSSSSSASPPAVLYGPSGSEHPRLVTMSEVNFKYLKHVIFKFFTSPDTEVTLFLPIKYESRQAN